MRFRERAPGPVSPVLYDRTYFLKHCGGHELYDESRGARLDARLSVILQMGCIQAGMWVLDLGCGRGELSRHAAQAGAFCWGLDLSSEALSLCRHTMVGAPSHLHARTGFLKGTAELLPFERETFHRVFLSDILEHLEPLVMKEVIHEVHRVLRRGGWVIFHTFPNRWFYDFYYPMTRLLGYLPRGTRPPRDPRTPHERGMHVNELSPLDLVRAFRRLFDVAIWPAHRDRWRSSAGHFEMRKGPLTWVLEPEIWGRGIKRPI